MATQTICDRCGKVIGDGESMSRFTLDVAACILDGEGGWLLQDGPHDKDLCEKCTIEVYEYSTKRRESDGARFVVEGHSHKRTQGKMRGVQTP